MCKTNSGQNISLIRPSTGGHIFTWGVDKFLKFLAIYTRIVHFKETTINIKIFRQKCGVFKAHNERQTFSDVVLKDVMKRRFLNHCQKKMLQLLSWGFRFN